MSDNQVLRELENGILTLTLNRPEALNATTLEMGAQLYRFLEDAQADPEVRVVVLTGAGRAFCAGGDVKGMNARADELASDVGLQLQRIDVHSRRMSVLLRRVEKPVIAMVNGAAAGWGCDLALACDIRVASDRAKFSEAFVKRGLLPDGGATYLLPRLIGLDRALELMWTGDLIDAGTAERLRLVTHVVPPEELRDRTMELAGKIAASAPLAVRMIKRAVYRQQDMNIDQAMEQTALILGVLRQSGDHREGVRAFVEKRQPTFTGR
ncbi:MAG: enoyl-CoA hydratase [Chloroflexi bacterium]|nr:enoyl-CoA hydratase [Chloroflexota bacterium]